MLLFPTALRTRAAAETGRPPQSVRCGFGGSLFRRWRAEFSERAYNRRHWDFLTRFPLIVPAGSVLQRCFEETGDHLKPCLPGRMDLAGAVGQDRIRIVHDKRLAGFDAGSEKNLFPVVCAGACPG